MSVLPPLQRVLIVKLWALGDILMATPLLAALRGHFPGVEITWVVDSAHAEILEGHPLIDELICFDSSRWRGLLRRRKVLPWFLEVAALRRAMQARRFDAVINCHPDKGWTRLLCAAPVRVGLYPTAMLPLSRLLYTHPLGRPVQRPQHNTDHYLMATQALGCPDADKAMTLGELPEEAVFVTEFRRTHGLSEARPLIVISPFSTGENRNWPPECYALLADRLAMSAEAQIVLTVGPRDYERAAAIASQVVHATVIVPEATTLRQYTALVRAADLVISGDSSAMHLAAAVGTPYVALFGPTPIAERAPLVGSGIALSKPLPCAPCDLPGCTNPMFRQCMRLLEVGDVEAAALRCLHEAASGISTNL